MVPIIFYHKSDFDGVCSAAIILRKFPCCELYGLEHDGSSFPWDKVSFSDSIIRRKVYLVDFSLDVVSMGRLNSVCDLVWIDHHISSITSCCDLDIPGLRSASYSACELVWRYINPSFSLPLSVKYLGIYDSWRNSDKVLWEKSVVPFHYGMLCVPSLMSPSYYLWDSLFCDDSLVPLILEAGFSIKSYQDGINRRIALSHSYEVDFFGNRCIVLNTQGKGSSSFDSIYDPSKHDLMLSYSYSGSSSRWLISLYSTKSDIDCSEIAVNFGGGGHKGAAGFSSVNFPDFLIRG